MDSGHRIDPNNSFDIMYPFRQNWLKPIQLRIHSTMMTIRLMNPILYVQKTASSGTSVALVKNERKNSGSQRQNKQKQTDALR